MEPQKTVSLVPMAHVADLAGSVAFYGKLGFTVQGNFVPDGAAGPIWVSLCSGQAELMLTLAAEPVAPARQGVLFYLYCADVAAMHAQAADAGLKPDAIIKRFYNPEGEFRLVDPDGYVVIVTHY